MLAGFLLGAISVFMMFTMFEIIGNENSEYDNIDKWGQIFGMSMIWLLFIGLILAFAVPADSAAVASINYSGAGIK